MPCRDSYDTCSQADVDRAARNVRAELEPLLCEACSLLENVHALKDATPELQAWYEKHEKCEEDRVRLEAAQKLTERERRLLGINLFDLQKRVATKK
jgi:hypothetical protein